MPAVRHGEERVRLLCEYWQLRPPSQVRERISCLNARLLTQLQIFIHASRLLLDALTLSSGWVLHYSSLKYGLDLANALTNKLTAQAVALDRCCRRYAP